MNIQILEMVYLILAILVIGIIIFHIVHYRLYCRHKKDPARSHCKNCKHLTICQKHHNRK